MDDSLCQVAEILYDDGFFEAVEIISRQKRTANIWVSFPSVRELLARCILCKHLRFTMLLRGAFCVELARFAFFFFAFSGPKKAAISPLLLACLLLACFALGPASGMLGVLAAQPVRGMLGMAGVLGMLMLGLHVLFEKPVSRCSFALIRAVSWHVHGSFFV